MTSAHEELLAFARSQGLELAPEQLAQIDRFVDELHRASRALNLTSDTDPDRILLRHVADGLAAAAALIKETANPSPSVLDLGAGGGAVGMAVKIAWPAARVTLMEPRQRRFRFLNAMAARSGLAGLSVSLRRAERGASGAAFDAVAARALAPLAETAELALPLTAAGGVFLAFQSRTPDAAEPRLARALARQGARLVKCILYRLPREGQDRCLALFRK
ncbi:MAG: class I SAM-dependent methyltransferase [Elusimicrobia bacterium]|nr:class I SAM-dependent methyltransferase [Elusimicrobiota bacterium]